MSFDDEFRRTKRNENIRQQDRIEELEKHGS